MFNQNAREYHYRGYFKQYSNGPAYNDDGGLTCRT